MTEHPITPPPELVQQLYGLPQMKAIEMAFQAGADQELEACCDWVESECPGYERSYEQLRAARRPKTLSLKEQALEIVKRGEDDWQPLPEDWDTIRHALELLPDDLAES